MPISDIPTTINDEVLINLANKNKVDATEHNLNYDYILAFFRILSQALHDAVVESNVANTFSALQTFGAGIKVDAINEYTTNGNIQIALTGTGKAYYGAIGTSNEIATQGYVTAAINTASGAVAMTGATSGTAGVQGFVPAPAAGNQDKFLRGDATWGYPNLLYETNSGALNPAVAGTLYDCTVASSYVITLDASPSDGDIVGIMNSDGTFSTTKVLTINRNGNNIMGLAENMTVTTAYAAFGLMFIDASSNWILVPIAVAQGRATA